MTTVVTVEVVVCRTVDVLVADVVTPLTWVDTSVLVAVVVDVATVLE